MDNQYNLTSNNHIYASLDKFCNFNSSTNSSFSNDLLKSSNNYRDDSYYMINFYNNHQGLETTSMSTPMLLNSNESLYQHFSQQLSFNNAQNQVEEDENYMPTPLIRFEFDNLHYRTEPISCEHYYINTDYDPSRVDFDEEYDIAPTPVLSFENLSCLSTIHAEQKQFIESQCSFDDQNNDEDPLAPTEYCSSPCPFSSSLESSLEYSFF
ncbi:hypothetical protein CYY_002791 [Polysphondylium violaceum]|uniref:Uncharacterized protein n=1 Tax=Polysphondylium violaceum TaxID=133409 RepID=A0A8J4V0L8_9MYCE|nr:hypothetical protein CYY_002791 [Polysphondylium violaceum]